MKINIACLILQLLLMGFNNSQKICTCFLRFYRLHIGGPGAWAGPHRCCAMSHEPFSSPLTTKFHGSCLQIFSTSNMIKWVACVGCNMEQKPAYQDHANRLKGNLTSICWWMSLTLWPYSDHPAEEDGSPVCLERTHVFKGNELIIWLNTWSYGTAQIYCGPPPHVYYGTHHVYSGHRTHGVEKNFMSGNRLENLSSGFLLMDKIWSCI